MKNKASINKYNGKIKWNLQCIKKKEELLKQYLDLPAIESEFFNTYHFHGYNEGNEIAYHNAIQKLQKCSKLAIKKHIARFTNHQNVIQASKEYNSERDEGICYTVPSLTENTYMELNVSLNQPLSKKGRDVLVSSILREIPLSIIEEDDNMESENSQENQRVNYHDLNGGSDDSSNNDDNDESFNIEDEIINPEDDIISDTDGDIDIEEVLRSNPINIEALENDFDKNVKIDCNKLKNVLYHLYFAKYPKVTLKYSSISRDGFRDLKRNSVKRVSTVNDYNFGGMISKQVLRKDIAKGNNEDLKKCYCLHNIMRLRNCYIDYLLNR